jgi:hypothetical protein
MLRTIEKNEMENPINYFTDLPDPPSSMVSAWANVNQLYFTRYGFVHKQNHTAHGTVKIMSFLCPYPQPKTMGKATYLSVNVPFVLSLSLFA